MTVESDAPILYGSTGLANDKSFAMARPALGALCHYS
jgi:hypothetical protein